MLIYVAAIDTVLEQEYHCSNNNKQEKILVMLLRAACVNYKKLSVIIARKKYRDSLVNLEAVGKT